MPDRPRHDHELLIVRVPEWPDAWSGWFFRGGVLVSPDGHRITPERLRGLLFRQDSERRLAAVRAREKRFGEVVRGLVRNLARERGDIGR
jgi:hypothetical protein